MTSVKPKPPVKVIVQNIPLNIYDFCHSLHSSADCTNPLNCTTRDKLLLEQLFAQYGPSTCSYLWSDDNVEFLYPKTKVQDNFAHVIFDNRLDALRVCEAANNHEIRWGGRVLTLTAVFREPGPVRRLEDCILTKIFSMLDIRDRLAVEDVCQHWRKLALESWSATKVLDLTSINNDENRFKKSLLRCSNYLKQICCDVSCSSYLSAISEYCRNIETLTLLADEFREVHFSEMSATFAQLRSLKSVTLIGSADRLQLNFVRNLSDHAEKISINIRCRRKLADEFDFSRFSNLQSLALTRCRIGNSALYGLESLKNLTHLDFSGEFRVGGRNIEAIQSLTKLKTLIIPSCEVTDGILAKVLISNRDIEHLDISCISTLTDLSIVHASALPRLKNWSTAENSYITLNLLHEMPSLEKFDCHNCESVEDKALGRLIEFSPNLRFLNVERCPITSELFETADAVVKRRRSDVTLTIKSTLSLPLKIFSPGMAESYDSASSDEAYYESLETNEVHRRLFDDLYDDAVDEFADLDMEKEGEDDDYYD